MAKGGFEGFLNVYTKIVWAVVGTILALGLLCATVNMHKMGGGWYCWKKECPMEAQKK